MSEAKRRADDAGDLAVQAAVDAAMGAAVVTLADVRLVSEAANVVQMDVAWTEARIYVISILAGSCWVYMKSLYEIRIYRPPTWGAREADS